jgi:hypothetical protein
MRSLRLPTHQRQSRRRDKNPSSCKAQHKPPVRLRSDRHSTVYNYFWEWTRYGVLDRIHHELLVRCLEAEGRDASPTAAIIDTQVAKATEKGGAARIRSVIFVKLHAEHSAMTPARKPLANIYCERQALTMRHQAHA